MASRMSDERTSLVAFGRQHVFVTLFGLLLPVALFAGFIGYPIVYTIYLSFFEWNGMVHQEVRRIRQLRLHAR